MSNAAMQYAKIEHLDWSGIVSRLREEAGWLEALQVDMPEAQSDIMDVAFRLELVGRKHGYIR